MSRIDCTPEEKIHDLLVYLKKERPDEYESAKKILKYLYKTINEDFFEKSLVLNPKKDNECESYVKMVNSTKRSLYDNYINNEGAILDIFINLCHDNPKYFNVFYHGIETYLEMFDEHLYSSYEIINYVFNIYVMLKGYEQSKGDFEFFSKLVKEYASLLITYKLNFESGYSTYSTSKQDFVAKQEIIDSLIELKIISGTSYSDEMLKEVLDEINLSYNNDLKRKILKVINDYKSIHESIQKNIPGLNKDAITQIETNLIRSLVEYKKGKNSYYSISNEAISYFSMTVLFGERYEYLKKVLDEVEPTHRFKKDILTRIDNFDYEFFEFLNQELSHEQDSFIICMSSVFDSDTYYELISKMDCINNACKIYKEEPKKALKLISTLNTNEHKEEINGVIMAWPKTNSINKPNKPTTILERTIILHSAVKFAPSEKYYKERTSSRYYSDSISSFVKNIREEFKSNEKKALDAIKKQQEIETQQQEQTKKVKGLGGLFKKGN